MLSGGSGKKNGNFSGQIFDGWRDFSDVTVFNSIVFKDDDDES